MLLLVELPGSQLWCLPCPSPDRVGECTFYLSDTVQGQVVCCCCVCIYPIVSAGGCGDVAAGAMCLLTGYA